MEDFLYICDDAYTREELISMETSILQTLAFDINIPIAYRFLRRYAKVRALPLPPVLPVLPQPLLCGVVQRLVQWRHLLARWDHCISNLRTFKALFHF